MNESKPSSGWNEAKPSFPITMNVGEAMAYASKDKCFWAGEVHTALETLAAEIERLRAELAETKRWLDERSDAYGKTCSMVDQLQDELAAAKAEVEVLAIEVTRLQAIEADIRKTKQFREWSKSR